MNKRLFFIFFAISILLLSSGESAYSQLLEDRNKLKTVKRDRKPFTLFKDNVKKPAKTGQKPDVEKARPVRTTRDLAGKDKESKSAPRYTQDVAGKGYEKNKTEPRFSSKENWKEEKRGSPRFTQETAGQGYGKNKVNPRFSNPDNWKQEKWTAPRFTQETAGQGYDKVKVNPRFSIVDYSVGNKKAKPRFSIPPDYIDHPAGGQRRGFLPVVQLFQPKPRYKQGKEPNYFGPEVKQIYFPSNSMAKHNQSIESYQRHISKGGKNSPYSDQTNHLMKTKKMKRPDNAHPSANYLTAKYDDSAMIRNTKRKFNVTWVRTFGNKTQPKGVKKKPSKSKFDKDEKDIWNNEGREYTRN